MKDFAQPEKPFLIHYENKDGDGGWSWHDNRDVMMQTVTEYRAGGLFVVEIIEVESMRRLSL